MQPHVNKANYVALSFFRFASEDSVKAAILYLMAKKHMEIYIVYCHSPKKYRDITLIYLLSLQHLPQSRDQDVSNENKVPEEMPSSFRMQI